MENMSDEEIKAIEYVKNEIKAFETVITAMEKEIDDKNWLRKNILEIKEDISVRETILNLIEKQSKEIEKLKEVKWYYEISKVPKDKIKAKIEVLNKEMLNEENSLELFYRKKYCKEVLQSLLEKE